MRAQPTQVLVIPSPRRGQAQQGESVSSECSLRAAGYPIGAEPNNSVSALVIRELQDHLNDDPDVQKNSATGGMKLGMPPEYNGALKPWTSRHGSLCCCATSG